MTPDPQTPQAPAGPATAGARPAPRLSPRAAPCRPDLARTDSANTDAPRPVAGPQARARLARLRRPGLLVRAARLAATAPCAQRRAARRALRALFDEEAALEHARRDGGLGYSPRRHVQVMSALIVAAGAPPAPARAARPGAALTPGPAA